jgi:Na+-driven multidrug efflux pump
MFSLITITIIRPILAYLLCYPVGWGIYGAWAAFMVDQFLRLGLTYQRFVSGKWAKMKL